MTYTRTKEPKTPAGRIFGETLGKLREKRKLSQEAIAHAANLTTNHLSDLERGKKIPTLLTIIHLAHALEASPAELLDAFTPAVVAELASAPKAKRPAGRSGGRPRKTPE